MLSSFLTRTWMPALVAVALLTGVAQAGAAEITQIHAFSGTGFDSLHVQPFDETLGTLDSIHVSIQGTLVVVGLTGQSLVLTGNVLVPTPYQYEVDVTQDFHGLASQYFHFNDPSTFKLLGTATGNGEGFALSTSYTYSFTLNDLTDLGVLAIPATSSTLGVLIPPVGGVTGLRSHFLDGFAPFDEIDLIQSAGTPIINAALTSPFLVIDTSTSGFIQLDYKYTPTPAAAEVPEPATIGLVATGLAMLARRRRKQMSR